MSDVASWCVLPAEWGGRVLDTAPSAFAAAVVAPRGRVARATLQGGAARQGWAWRSVSPRTRVAPARAVVLEAGTATAEQVARALLHHAYAGVPCVLLLGVPRSGRARHGHPWLAREAAPRYGATDDVESVVASALCRWRGGDGAAARRAVDGVSDEGLWEGDLRAVGQLVVLRSIFAREEGRLSEAEALARLVLLAARVCDDDEAVPRLALARTLLERGQVLRARGALDGTEGAEAAVRILAGTIQVRAAIAAGAVAEAGSRVEALAHGAGRGPWATVHVWDARARLRMATRDWPGAHEACVRGTAIAAREGWRRRVARFAALSAQATEVRSAPRIGVQTGRWTVQHDAMAVLETCRDQPDGATALTRVGAQLMDRLGACGATVVGGVTGAPEVYAACGRVSPLGHWVDIVAETGVARAFEPESEPVCGVPIRSGGRVVGVLICEWAPGEAAPADAAAALMEAAATAVAPVVRDVAEQRRQMAAGRALLGDLVGPSAAMDAVREAVMRAAASPFPVLIEGESGSGKELVARAVHRLSVRKAGRFVALNCAAVTDELLEAELFGHARGAFTGAVGDRTGLFEEASDGTLFLDEVAELSPRAQAKLLRVLQEGEVRRVGENRPRRIDVRVVAASNRALPVEVQAGRFRADLLYRLDVIRIGVPPLRARLGDLPALAQHLWQDIAARAGCRATLGVGLLDLLARHPWPGNVRELQNVLAMVAVSAPRRGVVPASALPSHFGAPDSARSPLPLSRARQEFEARYVAAALDRAGGRPSVAARELGLTRQGLAKLMTRLHLPATSTGAGPRAG
ncbi:MAG: sigma-54 dependent transcriptional regulator [Vicinamibacterales bacterium]|nr:sigma-54 dependent transcriptional regulator [Vicinamibacterales bacterium]